MNGAELITAERARQLTKEMWSATHDDSHDRGEIKLAAISYLLESPIVWPWDGEHFKPKDEITNLVRAGALIAAEIDRLQRAGK